MKINNFKVWLFISASLLFLTFTIITFIAYGAVEEGTDGNNPITRAIARLYYIFRFPTHTLFFSIMNSPLFFLGLVYNCLFYGFLTERIVFLFNQKKSN
ncbi:hypothetical protein CA265_16740 [Sphingobacteriaceae bacterium GW460-11-11-14-LB5]|nr:hypothetical protein CA265_16740 [Sphingobacteriaceae bacterium GW460-11-11-14-LB5]